MPAPFGQLSQLLLLGRKPTLKPRLDSPSTSPSPGVVPKFAFAGDIQSHEAAVAMLDFMTAKIGTEVFENILFTTFELSSADLAGSEKSSKMRELVMRCQRNGWQKILAEALGWQPEAVLAPRQGAQSFNELLLYAVRLNVDSMKFTKSKGAGASFLTTGGNIGSQNEFDTLMVISGVLTTDSMVKVSTLWIAPGARVQFDSQCEIGKVMMIPGALAPQGGWRTNIPQHTWMNETDFVNQAKSLGLIP